MLVSDDVLLDAARFLTRTEVDKCQLLSKRLRGFVDAYSSHLPCHYLIYVVVSTRVDGLIHFETLHVGDAGANSQQRRTLTDLTQAGDIFRVVSNSKIHCMHIRVQLEEVSRSRFMGELKNLQVCVEVFSLGRPLTERYSPVSDRQTLLVHSITSNALSHWQYRVLFCEYVESVTSLPSFEGIQAVSFSLADLPSDSAFIGRFINAGYVNDLRISVEAFTENRASANLEFFSRMISGFVTSPLRYLELEWHFVDYLSGIRIAIRQVLASAGFHSVGAATVQYTDSEKRRVIVCRRESDVRPVIILRHLTTHNTGHRCLKLRFFASELVVDEQRNLRISDDLSQAALTFQ